VRIAKTYTPEYNPWSPVFLGHAGDHSRGNAGNDSVAAGKLLRNACREVWQKQTGDADALSELSSWNWKRKRFVRKFESNIGAQNLNAILKKMDTRLESWLAACEQ
jgi:hypothetical protein